MKMDLSIIIVEFMDYEILNDAVQSVVDNVNKLTFETIVISNSSYSNKEQIEICSKYPNVQFIFNQENVGFARAVNQGIKMSSGEFVLLLNPDAKMLDSNFIDAVYFMRENKNAACIGPMMIDKKGEIQDSCRAFMTIGILLKRTFLRILRIAPGGVLERINYHKLNQVDWLSGACMLIRKTAIERVGLMDERYFMYVEDMDWCRKFKMYGWKIYYFPKWIIEHNAGRESSGRFAFLNRLLWIHIFSLCKYYIKWSIRKKWKS